MMSTEKVLVTLDLAHFDIPGLLEALRMDGRVGPMMLADDIEQQTRPPKPSEPTGLGAVVEDSEGRRWIRLHVHDNCNDWYPVTESQYSADDVSADARRHYYQIDVPDESHILSYGVDPSAEGVTA